MDFINEMILKELKEDSRISMSELGEGFTYLHQSSRKNTAIRGTERY